MISEINQTPKALRIHIGVFGSANAGKSTLINAVTGQETALTSPVAGTTTDPVFKPMELLPLGPVVFIDTAGLDDRTELGKLRVKKSFEQLKSCDAAIFVISSAQKDIDSQLDFIKKIKAQNIPLIVVINEINGQDGSHIQIENEKNICVNLHGDKSGISKIKTAVTDMLKDRIEEPVITGNLIQAGDLVLLTAPQDIQAPKGRLILPEVQVTRDLLDNGCMVMTVTSQNIKKSLDSLSVKPALVVTDSQIFKEVNEIIPKNIPLTSFSLLMAKTKADIEMLVKGASAIDRLNDGDRVAVIESCSHHAMDGDIARVKIPALLRKYTGKNLVIDNLSGQNITDDISKYKLAVHCGGCMVNRKSMIAKQMKFEENGVPMTNFGVAIAYMNGMLDRVCY